jgi:hypothetical protein
LRDLLYNDPISLDYKGEVNMKRRMTLVLIGLLALSLISCNLFSRFAGKAQETAEAAVTSVVATVASLPTATTQAQEPPPPDEGPDDQPAPTATTAAQSPADETSGPVEADSLDNLMSYRADWTTTMNMPGQDESMVLKYKLEWVKDPPAQHVWMDMATGSFAEVIWIEDKVWVKAGDQWVLGGAESTEQAFEHFHDAFEVDDDMMLVGTESVNGMRAKHYVYDYENAPQNISMHREIWVADESDLPAVPVQAHFRMETKSAQGAMVTDIRAHLYDINTAIEIKVPQ